MTSVFRSISQHQFLFLCYMLPIWRFGSVHVRESVVRSMSSVSFGSSIILVHDNLDLIFLEFCSSGFESVVGENMATSIKRVSPTGARNTISRMIRNTSKQTTRRAASVGNTQLEILFLSKCDVVWFLVGSPAHPV